MDLSAAGDAHVTFHGRLNGLDLKIMAPRLAGKHAIEQHVDMLWTTISQSVAQLDLLVMAQAAVDGAGRGDAGPVAAGAEV